MKRVGLMLGAATLILLCLGFLLQPHWLVWPSGPENNQKVTTDAGTRMDDRGPKPQVVDATGKSASGEGELLLDELIRENPPKHPGDIIAEQRTEAIIAKLESESVDESLANLDDVKDYYYPGFYNADGNNYPFDDVQVILSNRRFVKLYEDLRVLSEEDQYGYLKTTFDGFLAQYEELVIGLDFEKEGFEMGRRSDRPEGPPTFWGTRHALQSLSLLSGMLGNARMWPALKTAFSYPRAGIPCVNTVNDERQLERLTVHPAFPASIVAQTAFLMVENADEEEAREFGLDTAAIRPAVSEQMVQPYTLPAYQSRLTVYDVLFKMDQRPIDLSHGSFDLRFLRTDSWEPVWRICEQAGITPLRLTIYRELALVEGQAQNNM